MVSRLNPPLVCSLFLFAFLFSACSKQASEPAQASADVKPAAANVASPEPAPAGAQPASTNLPKPNVNGSHVMQYVKEVVAFGPRPPGSTAHLKLE